jgi:hypothetical protein
MNDKEEIKKEQKLDLIKEREMLYKNKKSLDEFDELLSDFVISGESINYKIDNILKDDSDGLRLTENINKDIVHMKKSIEEEKVDLIKKLNELEEDI